MCSTCGASAERHAKSSRWRWLQLWPLVTLVISVPLVAAMAVNGSGRRDAPALSTTHRVFLRDLEAHSRAGLTLGREIRREAARPAVRDRAATFIAAEAKDLEAARRRIAPSATEPEPAAADPSSTPSARRSDRRLVDGLIEHHQVDLIIARIEISAGADRELQAIARQLGERSVRAIGLLERSTTGSS